MFDPELFMEVLRAELDSYPFEELREMSRAKHWCFTLNNYTQENVDRIIDNTASFDFLIFGREIGDSGTPHLQGFVSFPNRVRRNVCVDKIGQAHFTVARDINKSIEYCKKDGDYLEFGTRPSNSGTRSDLEGFKEAVRNGCRDMKSLRETFSEVVAKYPKFCVDFVQDNTPQKLQECYPLLDWQGALYDSLKLAPDDRSIFFIVDEVGNAGKSWFGHYYCFMHANAQVLLPGKKADMSYALDENIRVLFIDAPRSKQGEFIQYDFLEDVKNGYVFCSKYESRVKRLGKVHVVVFMNENPDMNKLSKDRYVIRRVSRGP